MKKIVLLDGSLHGKGGNTHGVTEDLLALLPGYFEIDYVELKNVGNTLELKERLRDAYGFIIATGTYWQSWGSPLQRFFEQTTAWEASDLWMGKPVCTVVTMHSIGGVEVMSRLQSNVNMLGAFIPPMCSIVHSHVNQMAGESADGKKSEDIWDLRALPTIAHNFQQAVDNTHHYQSWKVDQGNDVTGVWLKKKKPSFMKRLFSGFTKKS